MGLLKPKYFFYFFAIDSKNWTILSQTHKFLKAKSTRQLFNENLLKKLEQKAYR